MVIVVAGVSGAGKTTIGQLLAETLGWHFYDGDDFHPQANIDKMHQGLPLTDDDRWPWLQALRALIERCLIRGVGAVVACSALKKAYRDYINVDADAVRMVYLQGSYELIRERLEQRHGHFMPPDLLASQFAALEEPEDGVVVDVAHPPAEVVALIRQQLGL